MVSKLQALVIYFQNQISVSFGVDVHPAARIGCDIMLDHSMGIVIGETAVVENDVSILQSVTLGGTGKTSGDRHPTIREGVMIGAAATILGEVGRGAKIATVSYHRGWRTGASGGQTGQRPTIGKDGSVFQQPRV